MEDIGDTTFVIDGPSLAVGIIHCPDLVAELALKCSQSIFCRMAPLQKAQVQNFLQKSDVSVRKLKN